MKRPIFVWLSYTALVVALVSALGLAVAPFSKSLVEQWSRRDVESRSRLVFKSISGPVVRAVEAGDQPRLHLILDGVAQDERILAVGLCDQRGRLRASTNLMPRSFSCQTVARAGDESFSSVLNNGRRVLVAAFPVRTGDQPPYLIVLHDLTYLDARSGQVQIYALGALISVALVVAGFAALLVSFLLRRWMASLRNAVESFRIGALAGAKRDPTSVEGQIQRLLQELKDARTPTEMPEINWTPATLHTFLEESLPGAEVIIISNREPYIHNRINGQVRVQTPASGLVSALEPIMRACGGTWIAHGSGDADRDTVDDDDHVAVPPDAPEYQLRRIWVSDEEQEGYYYGLANEGLWPLCHIAFVRPVFRESDWRHYEAINRRFADAVVEEARTDDPIVLVQDYHFALAPRMIRERLPRATIITFWHIPWPNAETFGICPWKEQILEGLLGSSIIGFHTQFHCNNFFETIDRFIESRIDREHSTVVFHGRETRIRPYPISIAWPPKAMSKQPPVALAKSAIRRDFELPLEARVGIGIERFDYTKGILDRMRAIDLLLTAHPQWIGVFTFIQVAAPTRSKLEAYNRLEAEAIALAEEINVRHGRPGYQPIRLVINHHEPYEVFGLFRGADLCIVSSLHDGMNLVAKEFVASRDDECGVLILSNFAGASRELSEALIVNPYDAAEMADALHAALLMPENSQRERMRLMRQQVQEQNVYRWAGRMLLDAGRIRQRARILALAEPAETARTRGALRVVGEASCHRQARERQ